MSFGFGLSVTPPWFLGTCEGKKKMFLPTHLEKSLHAKWSLAEFLFVCDLKDIAILFLGYKCYNADFKHGWQRQQSDGTCCGISSVHCTAVWQASTPSWKRSWRRWDRTTSSWSGSTTTWNRPARSWGGCTTTTRERWLTWGCCTSRCLWNLYIHAYTAGAYCLHIVALAQSFPSQTVLEIKSFGSWHLR